MIKVALRVRPESVLILEFVTLQEAADGYGLHPSTTYNYSCQGTFPSMGRLSDGTYVMERNAFLKSKADREAKRLLGRRRRWSRYS